MRFTVKTAGFREMDAALGELKKATARNVMRRAGLAAMQPVADEMERRAPEQHHDLKDAIDVSTRTSAGRHFRDPGTVEIYAGVSVVGGGMPPQATQQEFGNENHGPQPYARPGWDAEKQPTLDRLKVSLGNEVEKAAARAQKKALKAKGG